MLQTDRHHRSTQRAFKRSHNTLHINHLPSGCRPRFARRGAGLLEVDQQSRPPRSKVSLVPEIRMEAIYLMRLGTTRTELRPLTYSW